MAFLVRFLGCAFLCALRLRLAASADYTETACLDVTGRDDQGTVSISCPDDHVISIDDAVLGRNKWDACIITKDDCSEKTNIFQVCNGQQTCTRTFKTYTKTCGFSSMLVLGYSCIRSYVPTDTPPDSAPPEQQPPGDRVEETSRAAPKTLKETPRPTQGNSNDSKETGLIVGCVLASLVTVVFLIIAIVMVVRRLLQPPPEKDGNTSNNSSQSDSVFIKVDCFPCSRKAETPSEKPLDLRMRKKNAPENSSQTGKQKKSDLKRRMAPVGEESGNEQTLTHPESQNLTDDVSMENAHSDSTNLQSKKSIKKAHRKNKEEHKHERKHEEKEEPETSTKIYDNDNTLPSSYNKNFMPVKEELNSTYSKQIAMSSPQQSNSGCIAANVERACMFDAVAIPNTMAGTAC